MDKLLKIAAKIDWNIIFELLINYWNYIENIKLSLKGYSSEFQTINNLIPALNI